MDVSLWMTFVAATAALGVGDLIAMGVLTATLRKAA